jgi:hypothetical protein
MENTIINISPDVQRSKLNLVREWISDNLGVNPNGVKITSSVLRTSHKLKSDENTLEFDCKQNTGVDYVLDKKVSNDDIFFITDMLLCVSKEGEGEGGNAMLLSYPDPMLFSAAGEALALNCVYNAKLSLEDSHDKRFHSMDTAMFMKVPQKGFGKDSSGAITSLPAYNLRENAEPMNPFEIVSGGSSSKFVLNYAGGKYAAISDNGKNRVTIYAFGYKAAGLAPNFARWAEK